MTCSTFFGRNLFLLMEEISKFQRYSPSQGHPILIKFLLLSSGFLLPGIQRVKKVKADHKWRTWLETIAFVYAGENSSHPQSRKYGNTGNAQKPILIFCGCTVCGFRSKKCDYRLPGHEQVGQISCYVWKLPILCFSLCTS